MDPGLWPARPRRRPSLARRRASSRDHSLAGGGGVCGVNCTTGCPRRARPVYWSSAAVLELSEMPELLLSHEVDSRFDRGFETAPHSKVEMQFQVVTLLQSGLG